MKILDKQGLQNLPIELQGITAHKIASYEEKLAALDAAPPEHPDFIASLYPVFCASNFVADSCIRSPELIHSLVSSGELFSADCRQHYAATVQRVTLDSEASLMRELRQFRRRAMVRIAWRDLSQSMICSEIVDEVSAHASIHQSC